MLVATTLVLVGCASTPRTSGSGTPPPAAWTVADVQLPEAVITAPTVEPGVQCHPCHYQAENQLFGVAPWSSGLIAIGVQQPPPRAIAFTSADGRAWAPVANLAAADGTTADAVVSDGERTVIVGSEHSGATAWTFDGQSWAQAPDQQDLHVDYAAGAMTAVTVADGEFVAGGYRDDPSHNAARAAIWRSTDGLTWHVEDSPSFIGGRIWGLAANSGTIVAVGTHGDPIYGPAGAWRWTDETGWQQAQIEPVAGGAIAAVTAGPSGFVAVGKDENDLAAAVWTSSDGSAWTRVPDQPSLHYYQLAARMQSIVSTPGGFLVGGWRSDVAKGSGYIWTSADGVSWSNPVWQTSFSGGQMTGAAYIHDSGVVVGRTGYPDWNQATVWISETPFGGNE